MERGSAASRLTFLTKLMTENSKMKTAFGIADVTPPRTPRMNRLRSSLTGIVAKSSIQRHSNSETFFFWTRMVARYEVAPVVWPLWSPLPLIFFFLNGAMLWNLYVCKVLHYDIVMLKVDWKQLDSVLTQKSIDFPSLSVVIQNEKLQEAGADYLGYQNMGYHVFLMTSALATLDEAWYLCGDSFFIFIKVVAADTINDRENRLLEVSLLSKKDVPIVSYNWSAACSNTIEFKVQTFFFPITQNNVSIFQCQWTFNLYMLDQLLQDLKSTVNAKCKTIGVLWIFGLFWVLIVLG